MYVRKEKMKNLSHTLNILQYNKKKEQKERKMKKIKESMEDIKKHLEKYCTGDEDPIEAELVDLLGNDYEEISEALESDSEGFFLVHASEGYIALPYYWSSQGYLENMRYIQMEKIHKITVEDAARMEGIVRSIKQKEQALLEAIKTQRVRKIVGGKKR